MPNCCVHDDQGQVSMMLAVVSPWTTWRSPARFQACTSMTALYVSVSGIPDWLSREWGSEKPAFAKTWSSACCQALQNKHDYSPDSGSHVEFVPTLQNCKTVCVRKRTRRGHLTSTENRQEMKISVTVRKFSCTKVCRQYPCCGSRSVTGVPRQWCAFQRIKDWIAAIQVLPSQQKYMDKKAAQQKKFESEFV